MIRRSLELMLLIQLVCISGDLYAQSIYELRKITDQDWKTMSTEARLNAIGMANKHAPNQSFLGDFGTYYDLYKKWGYDYYEMEDRYENYSFRGFENYNIIEQRRLRWSYNEFGDRISKMITDYNLWNEKYYGDGTYSVDRPDDYINAISFGNIDGVWVSKEATDDWAFSAIAAGALRTHYTPLTLSIPNIDGVRLDFQSANTSASMVSSVLMGQTNYWLPIDFLETRGGTLLRGGHFRRKLGVLSIGATYVNQYSVQGNREGGHSWYGTVSNYTPTPIVVALRVMDDSPEDGEGGPIVNDVRLKVNGRYRDDIKPQIILDDITRDRTTAIIKKTEREYLNPPSGVTRGEPKFDFFSLNEKVPKYADYFYLNDMLQGANSANVRKNFNTGLANEYYSFVDPLQPVQINGTHYVLYWFDISSIHEKVNRVEAELTVSNDYRIQTTMVYTLQAKGGHDTAGEPVLWYNATYWKTMAQADGNIKDNSNIKRITVDFGVQVASIIYGVDMDLNYRGYKIRGEYVENSSHYMFPDDYPGTGLPVEVISGQPPRAGHKWSQNDNAWYITAKKDWRKLGFGCEFFNMGKFYQPYLDYFYGGSVDVNIRNHTIRFPSIEDNDDIDQYPDTMIVQRGMGINVASSDDPDGVFPGNDEDHDGIPDNNKNNNLIPDYNEPFLMFDSDPDEFVFGNDNNNNTVPDFREDDMKMDTPYYLDRQGHHIYFRYSPQMNVNLIAGSFKTKGVGLDNRTNSDYLKFQVNYNVYDIGSLYAEYRHERIQDNISDPYVQVEKVQRLDYVIGSSGSSVYGRFSRQLFYDELEYKNSSVNRLFIDSKIRPIPSVILENHLKFEKNNQLKGLMYDNTYQPKQDINTLAMTNKIVFTKSFGNWLFSPGIKFRLYKKDRHEKVRTNDYYMYHIPLIMFKYVISPDTNIMFGLQGIPGLELNFKDYIQSENNYKQKTYTLQLQNRTDYFGYQIWAATGFQFDHKSFKDVYRSFENYKSTTIFVQVALSY